MRKTFVRKVLLSRFKIRALKLLEYFSINYMKKCSDKYHFILSSNDENKEENLTWRLSAIHKFEGVLFILNTNIETPCKVGKKALHPSYKGHV